MSRNASSPATIASSARSQPSSPFATKRCMIPSVASMCGPTYAYQPASSAMFGNPACVRNRSSSSSGLIPASTRRNTLRISASSKTTDEFDCSPSITRAARGAAMLPSDANSIGSLAALHGLARLHQLEQRARMRVVPERVEAAPVGQQLVRLVRSRSRTGPRRAAARDRRGAARGRRGSRCRLRVSSSRTSAGS